MNKHIFFSVTILILYLTGFCIGQNLEYYRIDDPGDDFIERYKLKKSNDSTYLWNPLHVGDHWQFTDIFEDISDKKVLSDTTVDSKQYFKVSQFMRHQTIYERVDDNAVYLYDLYDWDKDSTTTELLCDSLNLPVGYSYKSYRYSYKYKPGPDSIAIIDRFYTYIPLFDDTVFAVTIEIWEGAIEWWLSSKETWAEKYGLIDIVPELNHDFLTGAIIDGITYGTIVSIQEEIRTCLPEDYQLLQNYPNPFNNNTKIDFYIPVTCNYVLTIYDVSGRLMKIYSEAHANAGYHTIIWSGKNEHGLDMASGLYLYQLKTDDIVLTSKMIFIK